MEYTEKDAALGKPLELFTVGKTTYKVPVLPMARADDWLGLAAEVDELEGAVDRAVGAEKRQAKRAYLDKMLDAVVAYCPAVLDKDKLLEGGIAGVQVVAAFQLCQEVSDPFEFAQASSLKKTLAMFKGLPISPEIVQKAIEKQEQEKATQPKS